MSDTLVFAQFKNFELGKEYQLYLIRDLLGQLSLVHFHGAQRKIKLFDDLNEAWREAQRASKVRLKNHYQLVVWQAHGMPTPEFIEEALMESAESI